MPELPEVETVVRGLRPQLVGRSFVRVEQRRGDLREKFPRSFARRLEGRRVAAVERRAKYILIRLDDGNVLVFDNGARPLDAPARSFSRVVEMSPRDGSIVWQYPKVPSPDFFSPTRGGAQPLPNGNVLITESTKGHVFEVTRDGEIVWDFWNPDFRAQDGRRRTIYRMRRMSLESYRALRR